MLAKQDILKELAYLGVTFTSAGSSCFLSVLYLHRALHCCLVRLPWRCSATAPAGKLPWQSWAVLLLLEFPEVWMVHFLFQEANTRRNHTSFFFSCLCTLLRCDLFALLFFRKVQTLPLVWESWGGAGATCLKHVVPLSQVSTNTVKYYNMFLEIHNLINLAKYLWSVIWTNLFFF